MRKCKITGRVCVKPTIFQITNIAGKEISEESCCEDCFPLAMDGDKKDPNEEKPLETPGDILKHLYSLLAGGEQENPKEVVHPHGIRKCSGCGCTMREISQSGKLGCAQCYETFKTTLEPLLQRNQKGMQHVGKIPKNFLPPEQPQTKEAKLPKVPLSLQIENQESAMAEAVASENYERAAIIRDSIKNLKEREKEIAKLGDQLNELVKQERYEEAAKIKQQIQAMR